MKGDDAYAHKYQNLEERSSKLSAYEIVQTIIGINLLIVTIVGVCISALKNEALCQVRGMGKIHSRNLGSILLLRFFLIFFKFDIIFIFRNK